MRSLRPGGRLVIADRGPPRSGNGDAREVEVRHHDLPPSLAESDLRQSGFEVVNREDRFIIDGPDDLVWWLIVARKL
jgi:SAM-dependent methyltransferase